MRVAVLAFGLFSIAFLVHWIVWRVRLPRRQTAVLLLILLGTLPIGLALCAASPALAWFGPLGFWQYMQIAVFHVAASLAYIVAYSALEGRSPSMALLVYVADAGTAGRSRPELEALLRGQRPVESRLEAMLRDDMATEHGDCYHLTPKGWAWARVLGFARNLYKMEKGG